MLFAGRDHLLIFCHFLVQFNIGRKNITELVIYNETYGLNRTDMTSDYPDVISYADRTSSAGDRTDNLYHKSPCLLYVSFIVTSIWDYACAAAPNRYSICRLSCDAISSGSASLFHI